MIEIKAPKPLHDDLYWGMSTWIFLAGSIEMGSAPDWQAELREKLADINGLGLLNPRRDDWDSSWEQTIDNPEFKQQVEWELENLARADYIFIYFAPGTKSPISLLELGLFASRGHRVSVCCPEGFWRKGNVDIVCERMGIHQVDTIQQYADYVRSMF